MYGITVKLHEKKMDKSSVIFSVDVEGIWTALAFNKAKIRMSEEKEEAMFEEGLKSIINTLLKYGCNATFFVLGRDAERFPDALSYIIDNDFEIANHTYGHPMPWTALTYAEKKKEILLGQKIVKQITSKKTEGFRAPAYMIDSETLSILSDLGYKYDSSILPTFLPRITSIKYLFAPHQQYYPNRTNEIKVGDLPILEIPISVSPILQIPLTWIFIKNLGVSWFQSAIRSLFIKRRDVVINVHSYDGSLGMFEHVSKLPWYISHNHASSIKILDKVISILKENAEVVSFEQYLQYSKKFEEKK